MKQLGLLCLLLATTAVFAQAPTRVRGTISSLDGDVLSVKSRDGKELKIQLAPDAQVTTPKAATASVFRPGRSYSSKVTPRLLSSVISASRSSTRKTATVCSAVDGGRW